jgi:hypothetical protein
LSNALALESGTVVEMTQFDSNDLDSDKEYSSMRKFLITLKINIKRIASLGTDKEKAALAKFRKDYNQVIIQPQWGGDTYRVATYNSKKVLYINARWGMFRGGYIISAKQALKDLMGINLDSRFMAD